MAQIDIDKFVISLRRCFGENKGIATTLDRCLFSLGLKYVDTPTGGRLERVDQPTMLEKIMWEFSKQKPAEWSKEDERDFDVIYGIIYNSCNAEDASRLIAWLKSLKDRVQPQPNQEWSEEDEDMCYKATAVINRLCADGKEYVWSVNTLKKLFYWLKSLKDRVQPQLNQELSEEDERIWIETIELLETANHPNKMRSNGKPLDFTENINWLKNIKVRLLPQPKQEWSEEDERQYRAAIAICNFLGQTNTANWLKSHRPQKHWKPSDEQLNSLYDVLNPCDGFNREVLESLYQDLKKLTK